MKCNGQMYCYPHCDECPRYMDDCDGSDLFIEMQEAEEKESK